MSDEDSSHFVVRCRGLPWSTTVDEIINFFEDCVFQEGNDSVHMTTTREGRPSGEAYIELATEEDLEKALAKDKKHMGKRYIEGKKVNVCLEQCTLFLNVCSVPIKILRNGLGCETFRTWR